MHTSSRLKLDFWKMLDVVHNLLENLQYITARFECRPSFYLVFSGISMELQI